MAGAPATKWQKDLQLLNDISSKDYENLRKKAKDIKAEEIVINLLLDWKQWVT